MHMSSHKESGSEHARGLAPCGNPVPFHHGDDPQRRVGDRMHAAAETQLGGKAVDVEGGIYGPEGVAGGGRRQVQQEGFG